MTGSCDRWLELPWVGVEGPGGGPRPQQHVLGAVQGGPQCPPTPLRSVLAAPPTPSPHQTGRPGPPGTKSLPPRGAPASVGRNLLLCPCLQWQQCLSPSVPTCHGKAPR